MSDIALRWDIGAGRADFALSLADQLIWTDEAGNSVIDQNGRPVASTFTPGDGLAMGDELLSALIISLFTDAEASADDVITDGSGDPRGWWGGPIGSKIWLRARSKATPSTLALVKNDIEQALAWLITDDIVARIDVATEWTRPAMLGASVFLMRQDGTRRSLAFSRLWETT